MKSLTIVLLLLALLLPLPAAAEEETGCGPDGYDKLAEIAETLAADIRAGEDDVIEALRAELAYFQARCQGLTFEGSDARVLGPVEIPPGRYRATARTEGYFIAQMDVIDGECSAGFTALFNLAEGQAATGAEKLIRSEGCTALIEVTNVTAPAWSLVIERLG